MSVSKVQNKSNRKDAARKVGNITCDGSGGSEKEGRVMQSDRAGWREGTTTAKEEKGGG